MTFGTVILCNVTKKMAENHFQNCRYRDDGVTNYVNIFEKLCEKWLKYVFFLKLTLWQLQKKFQDLFLAFECQDNIQIECIYVDMLIFLKNPINRC